MTGKRSIWTLVAGGVLVCAALLATAIYFRTGRHSGQADLLRHLPVDGAIVLSANVKALRAAGALELLAASDLGTEPEYAAFIAGTGFDFREDLDSLLASFRPSGDYYLLEGRFDWGRLQDYARQNGGRCWNAYCEVPGSQPDRRISFFPLETGVMAMAVSRDPYAAYSLQEEIHPTAPFAAPAEAVWARVPPSRLREMGAAFPAAGAMFSAFETDEPVLVALGGDADRLEVHLEAVCRSNAAAESLAARLTALTRALAAAAGSGEKPGGLLEVLAAGSFSAEEARLIARWPISPSLLDSLAR